MSAVDNPAQVMEATEGFVTEIDGERFIVNQGSTRVARDHPLVKTYPHLFSPVEDHLSFGTEDASADPGRARNRPRGSNAKAAAAAESTAEEN